MKEILFFQMYSARPDELMKSIKTLGNGVLLPPDPFKTNPRQVGRQSNLQVPKFPEKVFPGFRGSTKHVTEISLAKSNVDASKRRISPETSKSQTTSEVSVLQNSKIWTNKDNIVAVSKKRKPRKDFRLSVSDFERYLLFPYFGDHQTQHLYFLLVLSAILN